MGHLSRCTAVAEAYGDSGCHALGADGPVLVDETRWFPAPAPFPVDGPLLLDSYRAGAATVSGAPLGVMYDGGEPPQAAALAIAAGHLPPGFAGEVLAGPEHACLRRAFWNLPARSLGEGVERVLVTAGASPGPFVAWMAASVRTAVPEAAVRVAPGDFPIADVLPEGCEAIAPVGGLAGELLAADLAFVTGGQTMLEAAACGTPLAVIVTAENQRGQVGGLAARGAVRVVEQGSMEESLSALAASSDERRALSAAAQRAVDGRGAERVAAAIARLAG